jgi:hypothetical protein
MAAPLALAVGAGQACAMETGTYQPPDLSKFLLISEEDGDGDGDGVKETHILRYRNLEGDSIFSMTTKGRLWAWSLESVANPAVSGPGNYVIRDSDCDGTFDERYALTEEFHLPDCLK